MFIDLVVVVKLVCRCGIVSIVLIRISSRVVFVWKIVMFRLIEKLIVAMNRLIVVKDRVILVVSVSGVRWCLVIVLVNMIGMSGSMYGDRMDKILVRNVRSI